MRHNQCSTAAGVSTARRPITSPDFDEWAESFQTKPEWAVTHDAFRFLNSAFCQPDYEAAERFSLGASGVVPCAGPLVCVDRIYDQFEGEEPLAHSALRNLHAGGWIVFGLFRPDEALDEAVCRAYEEAEKWKRTPKGIPVSPLAAGRILAGGDFRASELLYQIRYWHGKATIWRGGRLWIVKTAAEWQTEAALSEDQYERALKRLKREDLVEAEPHQSKLYAWRTVTHLRPLLYVAPGPCLGAKGPGHEGKYDT